MTGAHGRARAVAWWVTALVGLAASAASVAATAPLQSGGARHLLGGWWVWADRVAPWPQEPRTFVRGGLVVVLCVLALLVAWLAGGWLLRQGGRSVRSVGAVAALWALPVLVVPPMLSRDAYAYLAQGAVAAAGGDPYRSPTSVLGLGAPLVQAVDPLYRSQISPYGPLGVRLFALCLAVTHHRPVPALLVLRLVVVAALCLTAVVAVRISRPDRRAGTLWLVAANPLLLLHLGGGLHLEAVVCALLALALLAHRKGAGTIAIVLVVVAAAFKVTAAVVVVPLLVATLRRDGPRRAARDLAAAGAAAGGLFLLLRPDPLGWVAALRTPLASWDPTALPTAASLLLAELTGQSPGATLQPLRLAFVLLGVAVAAWCCLTAGRRPVALTAGLVLAAAVLTGPVLWPWYLAPAVVCLVLAGSPRPAYLAIGLSCVGVLSALPMPVRQGQRVSSAAEALLLLAFGLAVGLALLRRSRPRRAVAA